MELPDQLRALIDDQSIRAITEQRTSIDGAKVVATFTAGVAATLVATALQVGQQPSWADLVATVFWTITIAVTISIFLGDELQTADLQTIAIMGGTPDQILYNYRRNLLTAVNGNKIVLERVLRKLSNQILLALITVCFAVVSLFWTRCPTLDW
jgi:hypothetical protein